jgi:hypothetical protein
VGLSPNVFPSPALGALRASGGGHAIDRALVIDPRAARGGLASRRSTTRERTGWCQSCIPAGSIDGPSQVRAGSLRDREAVGFSVRRSALGRISRSDDVGSLHAWVLCSARCAVAVVQNGIWLL